MFTVDEYLGLHNGYNTVCLAERGIPGEGSGTKVNCKLGRKAISDLEDASPFSESASLLIEGCSTLTKVIKSLGMEFTVGVHDGLSALIKLDTCENALLSKNVHEAGTVSGLLVNGLLEEDHS